MKTQIIGTPAQWREIAEAYRFEPEKRSAFHRSITRFGLCHAIYMFEGEEAGIFTFMKQFRPVVHPDAVNGLFWWPCNRESGVQRQFDLARAEKAEEIAAWIEQRQNENQ